MDGSKGVTESGAEWAKAMVLLREVLAPQLLAEWQPTAPQAVYSTWVTVWLLVFQRLNRNASLVSAVAAFLESMASMSSCKRVRDEALSPQSGGFSRARTRLLVTVAERAADQVFHSLLPSLPQGETGPKGIAGRRVFVVDGTSIALSPNAVLRQKWPPSSNQHGVGPWPICHLALLHELESGLTMRPESGAMYGPEAESEIVLAQRMIPRIPTPSVLLADRNFGVYGFVYHAVQAGHDCITRLTEHRFRAMQKNAQPLRPGVWTLNWKPTKANRKTNPDLPSDAVLSVQLHQFEGHSGQTMWIVTTLEIETTELAAIYARRAEIETDIRQWKHTLAMEGLRGRSVEMILKELAMAAIAYNLVVQIRHLASQQAGVPAKRISFSGAWTLCTQLLFAQRDLTPDQWAARFQFTLNKIQQLQLPNRPHRSYPRTAYSKRSTYPPKKRPDPPPNTNPPRK